MTAEQQGVSPASAGGASAPKLCFAPVANDAPGLVARCDLPWGHPGAHHGVAGIDYGLTARATIPEPFRRMFWTAAEDIANVIGGTVIDGEPRGYGDPEPRDTDPGKLREIASALHALLGEEDCTERAVTPGHLWYLVRLVAGHLDAISDGNRRGAAVPDPRDAEIEHWQGVAADASAELERIAAFVGGSTAMPGSVRSAVEAEIGRRDLKHQHAWEQAMGPLVAERDRLRREVASARSIADEKRAVAEELRNEADDRKDERDEARKKLYEIRALALRELDFDDEAAASEPTSELVLEIARRWRGTCAERDRLRQELDWIAAQPQGSNPYWQLRSKRVEDERDRLRKERDVMAAALVSMQQILTAADKKIVGDTDEEVPF